MRSVQPARSGADRAGPPPVSGMRATVQQQYGPSSVLRQVMIDRPVPADDQVLLRVRAASLHIGDWHIMTGQPYLMRLMGFGLRTPKTLVRGTDVAGTVEAVGPAVTGLRVGDDVFGTCDGALAELATARADTLVRKPAEITFEQAAAVPTSGCTALAALRHAGDLGPGRRIMIIGASGGVGLFAVQLAKSLGVEVTGVCSTAKIDLVRAAGADRVIDYTRQDLGIEGKPYDAILDLGGTRTLTALRRLLTPRGTLVLVGGEGGGHWLGAAMRRSFRAMLLSPLVSHQLKSFYATVTAADLAELAQHLTAGTVAPVIDGIHPLTDTLAAFRQLESGRAQGKIILTV